MAEGARIDIQAYADTKYFLPFSSYLAHFNAISLEGGGHIVLDSSLVTVDMQADPTNSIYAMNFTAIRDALELEESDKFDPFL